MKKFLSALIIVIMMVCSLNLIACETKSAQKTIPETSEFVGNVFQIIVKDLGETPVSTGSGFVFNKDGWFITNAHVMENAYFAQAIFNIPNQNTGKSFTYLDITYGTYYDSLKDIYIGRISDYQCIKPYYKEFPVCLDYSVGEKTYSIGYPLSSTDIKISEGKVIESWSDLYEKLFSGNSYVCSSSYIAPGSSGGILVNENLELLGITTLGWTDSRGNFLRGAAISAFNFTNLIKEFDSGELISVQERFHKDEKKYIGYYNEAKEDEIEGLAKKCYFDDGALGYVYEWENEGKNANDIAYSSTEKLVVSSDCWMEYNEEFFWENNGRRTISFYGFYDHQKGFANFTFEFKYSFENYKYYTVKCSDINYSPTISLTLNKCVVKQSSSYTPSQENINYAKEQFNRMYEWLTSDMARFG